MALVHPESMIACASQLDLFEVPPTVAQTEEGIWVVHKPTTSISDSGYIEFHIQGNSDYYLDLASTLLFVRCKVTQAGGGDLQDTDTVGPVNLWMHSLISQVDVYLNDKQVTMSANTYPYRAYFETLLNYSADALSTKLTSELYYKDTPGSMDTTDPTAKEAANHGLAKRYQYIKGSTLVEMMGGLHLDVMHMDRYLLSNVNLRIRLTRTKPDFCLMTSKDDANYKVALDDIALHVRRVRIIPSVINAHASVLLRGKAARYPLRRTEVLSFSVSKGQLNTRQDNLFLGQLPQQLVIGIVNSQAFNGSYKHNPFNFHHYNTNYISVSIDGRQVPFEALTPNFESGQYIQSFNTLYTCLDKGVHNDRGLVIDRDEYAKGYTLWAFNLTPDLTCGDVYQLERTGNLRLEIKFAKPLDHTVNVVVLAEFQNLMQIDMARSVIYDFGK